MRMALAAGHREQTYPVMTLAFCESRGTPLGRADKSQRGLLPPWHLFGTLRNRSMSSEEGVFPSGETRQPRKRLAQRGRGSPEAGESRQTLARVLRDR